MKKPVIISQVNVRLPSGWQGDANSLARMIADRIQQQAGHLATTEQKTIRLAGSRDATPLSLATRLSGKLRD
jgi:hypothetical protein